MALSSLWLHGDRQCQEDAPQIAVVDPLNASVMHITIGNGAFAIDMDKEKVLGCSMSPIGFGDGCPLLYKPCVLPLPPWLESSQIPYAGTRSSGKGNVKSNTSRCFGSCRQEVFES
ncbi:hypothetical protein EJB05_45924, partial [Eragrostis curvula]